MILFVFFFSTLLGCSGIKTIKTDDLKPITIAEWRSGKIDRKGIEKAGEEKGLLLKIAKGESFPLTISAKSELFEIGETIDIKFQQGVYMLMSSAGMQFSPDGKRWASLQNLGDLKDLFGLKKISFTFVSKSGSDKPSGNTSGTETSAQPPAGQDTGEEGAGQ
ncbi:MAG TPA: hypothetical protein VM425_13290 [Myxococcota bacterium]|nr:hypothetical protein [Myxococcota bacterium]